VAIDASLWDEPTTGIGLYTRSLVDALQRQGVRVRCVGARKSGEAPRGSVSRTAYFLTRLPSVLAQMDEPLFHAVCNFNLPPVHIAGKKLVLTIHDLIPDLFPETVSFAFRWQFRLWLARSLKLADRVICVSQTTRRDLLRRFSVEDERVSVIHNGVDHVDSIPHPDAAGISYLKSLALPPQYVLYAGALDLRKDVDTLLEAVERLHRGGKAITLVIAGQEWFGAARLAKRIARMRGEGMDLRNLGYQSAPVFYELMRRATLFVFPSRYEGFGLPPLEAMRLGVPTVVAAAGALSEICGDAAVQIQGGDAEALAASIDRLLDVPGEREALSLAGRERSERFSWDAAAEQTVAVYRAVLELPPAAMVRP
jgi:glycosyltransferase involved in cell wall biosynthesis